MNSRLMETRSLTAGYPSFKIRAVDLAIERGEFVGVIGPNGSGKTTLMKTLSRILAPVEGSVILEGTDIWEQPLRDFCRRVAVVGQEAEVPALSVREYVLMGRLPHYRPLQFFESAHDLTRAADALRVSTTTHLADKALHHLSGGERQMVRIARALAQAPRLLLLDEPTTHLDIAHQITMLDLIRSLCTNDGLTAIGVFHDLNLASTYCSRLIVMQEGTLRAMGIPAKTLTPALIRTVFGVEAAQGTNPFTDTPHIFFRPDR